MYTVVHAKVLPKDPKCPYPTDVPQGAQPKLGISTRNSVMSAKVLSKEPQCPYPTELPQGRPPNLGISTRYSVMSDKVLPEGSYLKGTNFRAY